MPPDHSARDVDEREGGDEQAPAVPVQRRRKADRRKGGGERRNGVERRSGLDRRRGPGRRRGDLRREAEEGEISGDLLEFLMAVDEYKRVNERPFPSWSEIFEIVHYLGYRKVEPRSQHVNAPSQGRTNGS
ncbi:MAG: hypothetical protein JSV19_12285 [Phycisphaerales bacterium]|nr:MAG: hypothetical protein JSV19_12285 [Phycisphaerales bacterium]